MQKTLETFVDFGALFSFYSVSQMTDNWKEKIILTLLYLVMVLLGLDVL